MQPLTCHRCGHPHVQVEACPPEPARRSEWVRVYDCPDELTALTLQAELSGHGIECYVRSLAIPGYSGLVNLLAPHWGWILVDREDVEESRTVLHDFLASTTWQVIRGEEEE